MYTTLIQKKGLFCSREFKLIKDRVIIKEKNIRKILQYEVMLDNIGHEKYYEAENTSIGKYVTLIIFLIPFLFIYLYFKQKIELDVVMFTSMVCWIFSTFSALKPNKDDIILIGSYRPIYFYRDKPKEEIALEFIDNVIQASKLYMKDKYTRPETYLSSCEYWEMIENLKSRDIISDEEFLSLKEKYQSYFLEKE